MITTSALSLSAASPANASAELAPRLRLVVRERPDRLVEKLVLATESDRLAACAHPRGERRMLPRHPLDRRRDVRGIRLARSPSTPSVTAAGNPPTRVAMTGHPYANDSWTTPDWLAER